MTTNHSETLSTVEQLVELLEAAGADIEVSEVHTDGRFSLSGELDDFDASNIPTDDRGEIDPAGAGGGTEKGDL